MGGREEVIGEVIRRLIARARFDEALRITCARAASRIISTAGWVLSERGKKEGPRFSRIGKTEGERRQRGAGGDAQKSIESIYRETLSSGLNEFI